MDRVLVIGLLVVTVFAACDESRINLKTAEPIYSQHCGGCHLRPDPKNIPVQIWQKTVLPEMAARLGYQVDQYNPLSPYSAEESLLIQQQGFYPQTSQITSKEWKAIESYILSQAPESATPQSVYTNRNQPLDIFDANPISLDQIDRALVANLQFDSDEKQFIIHDAHGKSYQWPVAFSESPTSSNQIISVAEGFGGTIYTEIGIMKPSQLPKGIIYKTVENQKSIIATNLHRPVFTKIDDLDGNGTDELLVCEFGNFTGQLSMWEQADSGFTGQTLLPLPGTIKLETVDLNADQRKDIVVLASQAQEGIYILYQIDSLQFRTEQVIALGPEYGSSWFELVDYDSDQDLDIVLVNGDNADHSVFPKSFHGIRLYLNDGKNQFHQAWFYPIYGATRVLAADFDQDQDLDFAVTAFFPEPSASPYEGFVYLENLDASNFTFQSRTFHQSISGRWLVMEKGDVDSDGDLDLMLGSFALPYQQGLIPHSDSLGFDLPDLMFLENQTIKLSTTDAETN